MSLSVIPTPARHLFCDNINRLLCVAIVKKGCTTMVRRFFSWGIAAILIFGPFVDSFAAEANGGKELYLKYCGSCHGSGAVRLGLKVKIPDLTLLKSKNTGIYPTNRVMSSIDGRIVRAHGATCQCGAKCLGKN